MPEDLELPADLIDLQRAYEAAQVAVTAYHDKVRAQRAEQYPDPIVRGLPVWDEEQAARRNEWPEEQRVELQQFRDAVTAALDALYSHPATVAAMADGSWKALHVKLKVAVEVPGWTAKSLS